jgi:hypothetical protein
MIDFTLGYLRDLLNQHLKAKFSLPDNKVVLSNLVENDGSIGEDKVIIFLLQVEEESSLKNIGANRNMNSSTYSNSNAPIFLNLHVFFCMNFKNQKYFEGLTYLSAIISFFQTNKIIKPVGYPDFSNRFEKISMELCKTTYDQMSNIWSAVGAKLLPSALYKVRLVDIQDTNIKGVTPAILNTESNETH